MEMVELGGRREGAVRSSELFFRIGLKNNNNIIKLIKGI
jgi:hypothetical protein